MPDKHALKSRQTAHLLASGARGDVRQSRSVCTYAPILRRGGSLANSCSPDRCQPLHEDVVEFVLTTRPNHWFPLSPSADARGPASRNLVQAIGPSIRIIRIPQGLDISSCSAQSPAAPLHHPTVGQSGTLISSDRSRSSTLDTSGLPQNAQFADVDIRQLLRLLKSGFGSRVKFHSKATIRR